MLLHLILLIKKKIIVFISELNFLLKETFWTTKSQIPIPNPQSLALNS